MNNCTTFGPFSSKWNLWLIIIDKNSLHLVKLSIKTSFKYALSQQIGFYSNHFENLQTKNLDELAQKHQCIKLNFKEDLRVKVKRNKHFGDKLIITYYNTEYKLQAHNVVDKEKLYKELKSKLGNKFIE